MYNRLRLYNFLEKNKSYFHSNLVFGGNILPVMLWFMSQMKFDIRLIKVTMLVESLQTFKNNWFASYLSTRKQLVSINGYKPNQADVKYRVPQDSIVGSVLFLIYINELDLAIKHSQVHHFADDTDLLNFNSFMKSINKQISYDLNNLSNWLKANKSFLSIGKTELMLFTSPKKQLVCDLKINKMEKGSTKQIQSKVWEFKLTKD